MNIGELKTIKLAAQLSDIMQQTVVSAVNNNYTLNVNNRSAKKFKIQTADTNAKTIALTNVSTESEITIKINFANNAAITFPTGVLWKDGVTPVFAVGKIYFIYLLTDDGGATYQGVWTGAW